ncbi:CRISPR system precrRNA processing endoribonuclease RAMP protein Cas6 [Botrimarina hoheduenensis]
MKVTDDSGQEISSQTDHSSPRIHAVGEKLPSTADQILFRFITPLRLAKNNRGTGSSLNPLEFVLAGRRRYAEIVALYGDAQPIPCSLHRVEEHDFEVLESNLHRWGFNRYSGRQKRTMTLAGLVGEAVIRGPWDSVGPWLEAAPATHLGKSTSFGFGRVEWNPV